MACLIKGWKTGTLRKTGIERALEKLIENIVTEITLIDLASGRETDWKS